MPDATKSVAAKKVPSQSEIEFLAYQLFLQRGGEPGDDLADWLAAEEQLKTRNEEEAPAPQHSSAAATPLRKGAAGD
ncbi:MAG: DUF2934 domain-containing protein [Candidatus Acidiferrales bacterium]